jgi:UDP-N-acetylmuramoylalanine--D-glutamate ligase
MECKCNIFKHQNENDYFIYNIDNNDLVNKVNLYPTKATKYEITLNNNRKVNRLVLEDNKIYLEDTLLYEDNNERNILGKHNLNNIMFALAVSNILKLDNNKTIESINKFKGLEHRLECVGTYNEITYYNDSICTIPEACILALETLKNVNTLLIGGMERDIDYSKLIDYLNNYGELNVICMPDTGYRIAKSLTNNKLNVVEVKNLEEAVKLSKEITKKGTICLLSPAAASYGFFKNFEERGNKFKELVKE